MSFYVKKCLLGFEVDSAVKLAIPKIDAELHLWNYRAVTKKYQVVQRA